MEEYVPKSSILFKFVHVLVRMLKLFVKWKMETGTQPDDSQSQLHNQEGENVPYRESSRGFVPYKGTNSAFVAVEGWKGQRVSVCL
ncbi:hypothetical protein QN277_000303 [Acacia crassicarpa]|uniref:Uncharacterized protein n=1 Tax=Acacia crassicarpa TaxID=499986 RepID=A0AAE1N609_9FABA|nr:hypothetical protein QN277_000303 [Acacia crassicarpa]